MVLADLGGRLQNALRSLSASTIVDEQAVKTMLSEMQRALLLADVNVRQVKRVCESIKVKANLEALEGAGLNKRALIQRAVFDSLCELLDAGRLPFQPVKRKNNVIMFVGLQGSGKTTSCTKLAYYYQRKSWKVCLVCADTYRAGAYDQLKQNATKANIPFYGSYTERDPVRVAQDGVEHFINENYEIIIVDTSGRHSQEAALFEEMEQVAAVVDPDDIVFVMDSSIGQAAYDQAEAFRNSVDVGSVIITKLDGHAKGGGALSAVSATKSPIIFVGTGEHIQEFEAFNARSFVGRLLGRGDLAGLVEMLGDQDKEAQQKNVEKMLSGEFNLQMLYDQLQTMMGMGSLSQMMSMIPGLSNLIPKGRENESTNKMNKCLVIMDSMTHHEMSTSDLKIFNETSRITRIARGAGVHPTDVKFLLFEFAKPFRMMAQKAKALKIGGTGRGGRAGPNMQNMNPRQMANMIPPEQLAAMGGMAGLQNIMKQMGGSGGGMPNMFG